MAGVRGTLAKEAGVTWSGICVPPKGASTFGFAPLAALACLALLAPTWLSAQGIENHQGPVVTGVVVDQQTRRPVPNAAVRLVTSEDTRVLGAAWTDQAGRYAVPLFLGEGEDPGDLVVEAGSLGYLLTASASFRLRPGRITPVPRISLRPEPVILDTIGVTPERRRWNELAPPRERVRRRQLEGRGIFLPGALVENAKPPSIPEFIADRVDGIEVEFSGGVPELRSTFYPRCLHVLVNEWPAVGQFGLERMRAREVGALEVYRSWTDVPDDLQLRIAQVASMRGELRCTVVNVWLWNSWNRGIDPGPGS